MAQNYSRITDAQRALIESAPVFFVASTGPAGDGGSVNVSPKGGVRLHVLSAERVAYLDFPGSGNETARHAELGGPITVMVCSFDEGDAAIVRLYGRARRVAVDASTHAPLIESAPPDWGRPRQVLEIDVESTMTSCGYGVPVMQFVRHRGRDGRGRRFKD